jgi:hypothetical protein
VGAMAMVSGVGVGRERPFCTPPTPKQQPTKLHFSPSHQSHLPATCMPDNYA